MISFATGDIGISLYIEFWPKYLPKEIWYSTLPQFTHTVWIFIIFKTQVHNINRVNKKMGKKFASLKEHLWQSIPCFKHLSSLTMVTLINFMFRNFLWKTTLHCLVSELWLFTSQLHRTLALFKCLLSKHLHRICWQISAKSFSWQISLCCHQPDYFSLKDLVLSSLT